MSEHRIQVTINGRTHQATVEGRRFFATSCVWMPVTQAYMSAANTVCAAPAP